MGPNMKESSIKEKAIVLRKRGDSYNMISRKLGLSKSTLSDWLKDYPLPIERIRELRDHSAQRIEKYRETRKKIREERLDKYCQEQKEIIFPFSKKELYLSGLFLYWGEGSKTSRGEISLSNTNPAVIKFFMFWLMRSLKVSADKLSVALHLYSDMDTKKEIQYWSQTLGIPIEQFSKPYIKTNSTRTINYKGGFGHGTCNLRVFNTQIAEKTLMALRAIAQKFNKTGM